MVAAGMAGGLTCDRSGDPSLSSLEIVVDGTNRLTFNSSTLRYSLWFDDSVEATVVATANDPSARINWSIGPESGFVGVGSGEVTVTLGAAPALFVTVRAGDTVRSYQLNLNPACPAGDTCSNGGGPDGTCVDNTCVQCTPGAPEVCDGQDNDCDGQVDENDTCTPLSSTCVGPSFRGQDLDGTDLSARADLECADFRHASLRGAVLRRVDLSFADFTGADLRDADLSGSDASDAIFSDADLSFADLFGTDLDNAVFQGADLTGAL
ncbi:MAG: pentapeptide repeat-containing protein [Myxococcota bacterium]